MGTKIAMREAAAQAEKAALPAVVLDEEPTWVEATYADVENGNVVDVRGSRGVVTNAEVSNAKKVRFWILDFETGTEHGYEGSPLNSLRIGALPSDEVADV